MYDQFSAKFPGRSRNEVFRRLLTLRKAARLPRRGYQGPVQLRNMQVEWDFLAGLIDKHAGAVGQRDRLPYSDEFENLLADFNSVHHPPLDHNTLWRLVLRLAK